MWFLSVGPEICLQLPSDSISRWTPLLFSYTLPTIWACSRLSPVRARPWRANQKTGNCILQFPVQKLPTGIEPVTSSLPMRCATYCATAACSVITDLFNIQYFPHTVNTFPICLFPQKNAFVRILTQLIFFYLLFKNLLTFSTFIFILRSVITYGELIC